MSTVLPFKGLRPKSVFASRIASPPYDVLSSAEARTLVKENRLSFLRVNKPEVDFPPEQSAYTDEVYNSGKKVLESMISAGQLVKDNKPGFYLYQLSWQAKSQTGLVCLCSVDEYEKDLIKKHELTRPQKVNDRADHMVALNAQVGPVMMTLKPNQAINRLFDKLTESGAEIDFEADDFVRHRIWVISDDESIGNLKAAFEPVDFLYIADGHHRSESAAEVRRRLKKKNSAHNGSEPYNYFLSVIFPSDQMRTLSYNRVVTDLGELSLEELLKNAEENFIIEKSDRPFEPQANTDFGIYSHGKWYKLTVRDKVFDADSVTASIGTAILENCFLKTYLKIEDVRKDPRIDFVGGIRGLRELERLVDSGKFEIAFSVSAVTVGQLLEVADANQIMPPKSTWFEPKLRSGLLSHTFD